MIHLITRVGGLVFLPFEGNCFVSLQFSQQEEKRQKGERLHQQQKHENQMREMIGQCEGNIWELQQLQVSDGDAHSALSDVTVSTLVNKGLSCASERKVSPAA